MKFYLKWKKILSILCLFTLTLSLTLACSRGKQSFNSNNSQNLAQESSNCRVISHSLGEECVSFDLKRPIVLGDLDNLLSLGIKPVGAALWGGYRDFPSYLKDRTEGITFLGTESEPNLEKIAYLNPNLILGNKRTHEIIYPHLSKIAPTLLIKSSDTVDPFFWKKELLFYAKVFNKTDTAKQLLYNYDQRIQSFKQQMGKDLNQIKVSVLRFYPGGVRLYLKNSFIGGILQDAGLSRPLSQNREGEFLDISPELISELDADVIFVMEKERVARNNPNESMLAQLKRNALWSQLKGVQNNQVYEISETVWVAGAGMIGINLILDDLFNYLVR
ncbi:periplasmic binding protein (plasmid) [Gloeothece citriformis PCC 7424]|uniref:Periplasmic binding protein n=1 Tax=Gloeothece citriformis (strain PCC 7424) TaxID=65393 RepID=B7KM02_GLOC7|nr:iron-siderophore ABC transporter substrate-binding protein [Gloeothece citriformis]ACK73824.1 periplasmic binding protein [Gloeothece citriformis PCC 7424]